MMGIPRLKEGQTPEEFLGDLIRSTLDSYASMWDMEVGRATDAQLTGPPIEQAQALVAYVRDPANTIYTIPAYAPPEPPPGTVVAPPVEQSDAAASA